MGKTKVRVDFGEDWLAVMIAFGLIILSAIGILGKNGINIIF